MFWGIFWRNWWRHEQVLREIAQKLSASVHLVKNIRSIECQMCPQDFLIFLKGQEFLCSKLSWGFHFGSNGQYTFLNWFFCAPFFVVVVVVVVFVCFFRFFLQKKNYLYIYFVIGTENLNIKVKVVIWTILVQYTFLILVFCTLVFFVRLIFLSLFFIFIFFSWQRWATMCL